MYYTTCLSRQTVKKIFKEIFINQQPVEPIKALTWQQDYGFSSFPERFTSPEGKAKAAALRQQEMILGEFKQKLNGIKGIKTGAIERGYQDRTSFDVTIDLPSNRFYAERYTIKFDKDGYLELKYYDEHKAHIKDINAFIVFRDALYEAVRLSDERHEVAKQEAPKKDKIRTLKKTAIVAKLKEIVEEAKVEYEIDDSFATRVQLVVYLANSFVEISVPLKDYQNVLQAVPAALQSIKDWVGKGVSIKIK
jgi:hypothetical protein